MTGWNTLLIILISLFFGGCAGAPPEPQEPETLAHQLTTMKSAYWSCSNLFTAEDVSLVLGARPEHCKEIETGKNTIGVIIRRDQPDPIISCVLPGSPAESGGLQRGARIWAVATDGVATPDAAHNALQKHMKVGKSLVISTDRGTVSVVPQRAVAQECSWEVQGNVSVRVAEGPLPDSAAGNASAAPVNRSGLSRVVGTFLNGWLVDIAWSYEE